MTSTLNTYMKCIQLHGSHLRGQWACIPCIGVVGDDVAGDIGALTLPTYDDLDEF